MNKKRSNNQTSRQAEFENRGQVSQKNVSESRILVCPCSAVGRNCCDKRLAASGLHPTANERHGHGQRSTWLEITRSM